MNLKNILKTLKLNESTISMVLGAAVILVVFLLVVRYFRNLKVPSITTPGQTETQGLPKTHTVSAGESLWTISEKYYGTGYNWVEIAKANSLKNPNQIEKDQKLVIPEVKLSEKTSDSAITGGTYTVVKGDSLWKIAVRAYGDGYKWVKIARENKLKNPDVIHAGNVLTLP